MFDLKCKRQGCVYNKNCNCTADRINVGKMTECQTYRDSGEKTKQEDKIDQPPARQNIKVTCDAKCLFNCECNCKANGISVMTNDGNPECCTFMPK